MPVVTALDRAGGVVEAVLDGRREDDIVIALRGSITPGSLTCSDGLGAYPSWPNWSPASTAPSSHSSQLPNRRLPDCPGAAPAA